MPITVTNASDAMKDLYPENYVRDILYKNHPLLAVLPKNEKAVGERIKCPMRYGNPMGRSTNFATAKANKTNSKYDAFFLTRYKDYALASIENEAIEASASNEGAFVQLLKNEVDGALNTAREALTWNLMGTGSGSLGVIAASTTLASPTIQLTNPEDIVKFSAGQELVLSATDGGGTVRAGTLTVIGVDRDLGTILLSGNITAGVAAAAHGDYIFMEGDYDGFFPGFFAWLPGTAPTSTPFFGVDRTADKTRLGGLRLDARNLSIEEALITGGRRVGREGGKVSHFVLNDTKVAELVIALGSKVQYVNYTANDMPSVGFTGIQIQTGSGTAIVMADRTMPVDRCLGLQMDTWKLHSLGPAVKLLNTGRDGLVIEQTADEWEIRVGGYRVLGCEAPGYNINIQLS